jgi:anthranilate synthase component 1
MTFDEFNTFASSHTVVPVSKTMLADTLTPVSAYLRLRKSAEHSFLLESVEGGEQFARYSFIGCNPISMLRSKGRSTTIDEYGTSTTTDENFFTILESLTKKYHQPPLHGLPRFTGGWVGFIGYDAIRFIEDVPCTVHDTINSFDSVLGLFTTVIAFDHLKHQIIIIVNVLTDLDQDLGKLYHDALSQLSTLETQLRTSTDQPGTFHTDPEHLEMESSKEEFESMVTTAKQHITDGDIFQVVLSQRFSATYTGDEFNVYRALRVINPSPYLYYLDFKECKVIGSSPEILVRKEHTLAETYPIAGTRPRGTNATEERELEKDLLADAKEIAEHIMLVDLGRNDLGRVCEAGSVKVDQLMNIVKYSHVMHIASRVIGRTHNGTTSVDVLKAAFPAGTVSGAPKIKAMEIIDTLETTRRGIYAGGVGYFDFSGNMDMCIAIRTMYAVNGKIYFQAGAGIVADSDPSHEYEETINKARALVEALRMAKGITA